MKARTWKSFFKQGIKNAFGNSTMSAASIIAITAALCVLGIVMLMALNLNFLMGDLETKSEVTVFIDKDTKSADIKSIGENIKKWDGVYDVDFVSNANAITKWRRDLEDKAYLLEGYEGVKNPLPHSFIISIEKPEYIEEIASKAGRLPQTMKVNYSKEVAEHLGKIIYTVRLVGFIVVLILAGIAAIIINNTVKLTVYSRRREINIMKYIGATDWYIRWPFIIEGFTIGMVGSMIASAIILPLYQYIVNSLVSQDLVEGFFANVFKLLPLDNVMPSIIAVFLLVGISVGIIGSGVSTGKYLNV